jgi:hypothetical protein
MGVLGANRHDQAGAQAEPAEKHLSRHRCSFSKTGLLPEAGRK